MTTQNTHHEQGDVDTSVVQHLSAPETTDNPTTPENGAATEPGSQNAATSSAAPTSPAEVHGEAQHAPASSGEEPAENTHEAAARSETTEDTVRGAASSLEASSETTHETPATSEATVSAVQEVTALQGQEQPETSAPELQPPVQEAQQSAASAIPPTVTDEAASQMAEGNLAFAYRAEVAPLVDAKAEEVRPFTDFIAEFRQAEAARIQATLKDPPVEAFPLLDPVEAPFVVSEAPIGASAPTGTQEGGMSATGTDEVSTVESASTAPAQIAASAIQEQAANAAATGQQQSRGEKETGSEPARPVSPLLRPASRLRVPRHNVGRHPREERPAEPGAQAVQPVQPAPASSVETPAEQTSPRPTRRYRFDRPAAAAKRDEVTTTGSTSGAVQPPAAPQRSEEPRESKETRPTTASAHNTEVAASVVEQLGIQFTEPPAQKSGIQFTEPPTQKLPAAQGPALKESTAPVSPTQEHSQGRRRHPMKEQPVVAPQPPAPEVASAAASPAQTQEVAPEDLPPLEYAELQKASTRRRRRHRASSTTVPAAPQVNVPVPPVTQVNTPVAPTAPVNTNPVIPVTPPVSPASQTPPSAPAAAAARPAPASTLGSAYSIVSGYTVSQMNQGSEIAGPFMGPDPSPARGSVTTRDGRNTRAEAQRTTAPASAYPAARAGENGLSTGSMNQFANVVSQAIQTQTDRMIAEMRRANQAPTSVSVTLPPFPSTERVGVFVDVANLLYSARTLRIGVDFGKLLDFLRGNRRLVRAHAYCPTSPQAGDEQMFLQAVKGLGYRITTKNYKTFSSGAKKADLDLDLCMDVVRLVDGKAVDCVVLVSGDSDFMPMLDYCSDHGVRVEVAAFDEAMSATLRQSCDLFINLSMLDEIRA